MFEAIGFTVFAFSSVILLASALIWIAASRARSVRAAARRICLTFAIFALAGGYVWTEAGPLADYRMTINEIPMLPLPAPAYYEI